MTTSGSSKEWWTAGGNTYSGGTYPYPYTSPQPLYPAQPPCVFPTTGTDFNLHLNTGREACMAMGHQAVEAQWEEGQVTAYCSICGEKLTLSQAPGGTTLMRVKLLLEILMALDETQPPGVSIVSTIDPLSELAMLTEQLEEDVAHLEQAESLLSLARAIIKQRVESGVTYGPTLPGPKPSSLH